MIITTIILQIQLNVTYTVIVIYSYDDDAEQACESAVQKALQIDMNSIDACQALVSLRISQCRLQEASEICERVAQQVLDIRKQYLSKSIVDEFKTSASNSNNNNSSSSITNNNNNNNSSKSAMENIPSADFATSTVKLLLECAVCTNHLNNVSCLNNMFTCYNSIY